VNKNVSTGTVVRAKPRIEPVVHKRKPVLFYCTLSANKDSYKLLANYQTGGYSLGL